MVKKYCSYKINKYIVFKCTVNALVPQQDIFVFAFFLNEKNDR